MSDMQLGYEVKEEEELMDEMSGKRRKEGAGKRIKVREKENDRRRRSGKETRKEEGSHRKNG